MLLNFIILFLFFLLVINIKKKVYNTTIIEISTKYKHRTIYKNIENHFIVFHVKNRNNINISQTQYFIEHNSKYDDILFLIPLYNILIKSKIIIICDDIIHRRNRIKLYFKVNNYTTYNNCIYFNISFLKYLHIHSNIFRFCNFYNVYKILQMKKISITNNSICKDEYYSNNYTVVTTVYKRNNLKGQISTFLYQSLQPKYIIVVHDRNIIDVEYYNYNIIYFHTINFPAGFYFRYLISILSPENNVIVYDDDWFPYNKSSHMTWISKIQQNSIGYVGHHGGSMNNMNWCATPLIIHRKWLYLVWYYKIYENRVAEDAHVSFSLLLLCNIHCRRERIIGLQYRNDKLSSSKDVNISKYMWNNFTINARKDIKSKYIQYIKQKYYIY